MSDSGETPGPLEGLRDMFQGLGYAANEAELRACIVALCGAVGALAQETKQDRLASQIFETEQAKARKHAARVAHDALILALGPDHAGR